MKKISRWIAGLALALASATSAFATDCTPQSPQYCTPAQLEQLRQRQEQAQQQLAAAQAELTAALINQNEVTTNSSSTAEARAAAQARVDNANRNLNVARGGAAAATLTGTVQGTNTLNGAPNTAGGANVVTNTSNSTRITHLEPAKPIAPTVVAAKDATAVSEPHCGPLRMIRKVPLEYFLVGHTEEVKVTLRGQTTDEVTDYYDEQAQSFKDEEIKRYPDGEVVHYGSIATVISVTLSGSVTKQIGFAGTTARGEGATVNNGVSSGFTIEKKSIYLARCELKKYRVEEIVPVIPKTTPVDVCPNIEGLQTTVPQGMVKDAAGNCVVKAPEPALDKKEAKFLTGEVTFTGPQPNRHENECLQTFTGKDGKKFNKWVPKAKPTDICGAVRATAPALTPATELVNKPAAGK